MAIVGAAKSAARRWVAENAERHIPGFAGAFLHGSINEYANDDAPLPLSSDVDVMVVTSGGDTDAVQPGKFVYEGALLEVSCLPCTRIASPEAVLSDFQIAHSFRRSSTILADPKQILAPIFAAVSQEFTRREWVEQRVAGAEANALRYANAEDADAPAHQQAMICLFAAGNLAHMVLVAGLKNPTVRRRYAAARDTLAAFHLSPFYPLLLETPHYSGITHATAARHLETLGPVFDAAKTVVRTPLPFAADLSDAARPIAIDGSAAMLADGDFREAMFWIAATHSRCQAALFHDAPPGTQERFADPYQALLDDLGLGTLSARRECKQGVREQIPRIRETIVSAILVASPQVA